MDKRILKQRGGQYIRKLRKKAGKTQLELSKALGYDYYSFISQVEQGTSKIPSEALGQWAAALNVDLREFATRLLEYYEPEFYQAIFGKRKLK